METDKLNLKKFKNDVLAVQISEILTEAILDGVLKCGDRLGELELQKQFGISRSPLREAFRDLEKKGLVVIIPRRGAFVREISRRDIEENFPVRASLEGLAASLTFKQMKPETLRTLKGSLDKMQKAVRKQDLKSYFLHHRRFHESFIEGSENSLLIDLLTNLRMHSLWYRFSYKYYQEDLPKSLAVHQKIYRLFANPRTESKELEETVKAHIEAGMERFMAYLEAGREKDEG